MGFERAEMLRLKAKIDKLLTVQYTEGVAAEDSLLYIPLDNDAVKDVLWQGRAEEWTFLWKKGHLKFL